MCSRCSGPPWCSPHHSNCAALGDCHSVSLVVMYGVAFRSYVWGCLFCVQGDQSLVSSSPQPRIENPIENTFMSLSLLVSLLSLALSSWCPLTRLSHSLWSLAVSLLLHRTFPPSFPALSPSVSSRLSLSRPPHLPLLTAISTLWPSYLEAINRGLPRTLGLAP